ncbi:MAG: PEP-CTERM sorting domain-containing protein [Pirellulales bacterium]
MRPAILASVFTVAALLSAAPAAAGLLYIDPLYGYQKTSDVQFGVGKLTGSKTMPLLMDVYQPTNIGKGAVQTNRPAVVIQDGGAWVSGEKDNGRVVQAATYLAQRGYTVFIADYRQVGDSPAAPGPGPWNSLNPGGNSSLLGLGLIIFPSYNVVRNGIEDFAAAITHVRQNAALYGIDPNHIAGAGGSAGGINLLDLQYNGDTTAASYRTQANVALVASMMGDWDKVVAGGAPLFMLNNALDPLIHYTSDVEPNLHNRLEQVGIYHEQWMQYPNITDHNMHYDQYPLADTGNPYMTASYGDSSKLVMERVADFLAYHFTATGPINIVVPEPASVALLFVGLVSLGGAFYGRRRTGRR